MVSADSVIEPMSFFLVFTKGLTVPVTSPALTLMAATTQNNFLE